MIGTGTAILGRKFIRQGPSFGSLFFSLVWSLTSMPIVNWPVVSMSVSFAPRVRLSRAAYSIPAEADLLIPFFALARPQHVAARINVARLELSRSIIFVAAWGAAAQKPGPALGEFHHLTRSRLCVRAVPSYALRYGVTGRVIDNRTGE
jgi:hypothetical protein